MFLQVREFIDGSWESFVLGIYLNCQAVANALTAAGDGYVDAFCARAF